MKRKRMPIKKVALIDLGEGLQINLATLEKKLNSIQSSFEFRATGGVVTSKVIGNPGIRDLWYGSETLLDKLHAHYELPGFDFVVGITNFRVTNEEESKEKGGGEMDYFSISDHRNFKFSLISTNSKVYQFNSKLKNMYQYVSYLIMCELLIKMTRHDLIHTRPDACLFDDCEDRASFGECINRALICNSCIADLEEHNISNQVIDDVRKVLHYCRRNDMKIALMNTLINPLTGLMLGTGIGWFTSAFIKPAFYPFMVIGILIIPLIIFVRTRYSGK